MANSTNINRKKLYEEALRNEKDGLEEEGNVRFERNGAGEIIYSGEDDSSEIVNDMSVKDELLQANTFQQHMFQDPVLSRTNLHTARSFQLPSCTENAQFMVY